MLVRFRENRYGVSADIQKFYNNLKLDPSHYKYQMAMWRPNMIPDEEAEEFKESIFMVSDHLEDYAWQQ